MSEVPSPVPVPSAAPRGRRRAASESPPVLAGVLLGVVGVLFLLLFALQVWRWSTGGEESRKAIRRAGWRAGARQALGEAEQGLAARAADPVDPLFRFFRVPEGEVAWIPAPAASAALAEEGVGLRDEGVRLELRERVPAAPGSLAYRALLRLEATVVRGEDVVARESRERPVRLVRTGFPEVFLEASWTCHAPARFLDRTRTGRLASLREDLTRAGRDLALLQDRRAALRPHLEEVRNTLGRYLEAFQHLGGTLENPLPAEASLLPDPVSVAARPELPGPLEWLRTDRGAVDLGEWTRLPARLRSLAADRQGARSAYVRAADDWEQLIRRAFQPARWEGLASAAALEFRAASTAEELVRGLAALRATARRWRALAEETGGFLDEVRARAALLPASPSRDAAAALLDPEVWKRQGRVLSPADLASLEGPVEGVRWIEGQGGLPVVLEGREITGPGVLVVLGDARIRDLRGSPRTPPVSLQVEGALELSGRVDAAVVSRGPLRMAPDTWVRGALVALGPAEAMEVAGWVEWDPALRRDPTGADPRLAAHTLELLEDDGGP